VALAGLLALAVAMGIGRFAFTPLLPMMLHDGVVDLPTASWLATANYLGYWLGAVACALQPWAWRRLGIAAPPVHTVAVKIGLVATVVLTFGMASAFAALWPLWRFAAGVASALVFVFVSVGAGGSLRWARPRPASSVGPGLGIAISGLAARRWSPAAGALQPAGRLSVCWPSPCRRWPGRNCAAWWRHRRRSRRRVSSSPAPARRHSSRWATGWPASATSSPPLSCR
jgi:hypothetical protein